MNMKLASIHGRATAALALMALVGLIWNAGEAAATGLVFQPAGGEATGLIALKRIDVQMTLDDTQGTATVARKYGPVLVGKEPQNGTVVFHRTLKVAGEELGLVRLDGKPWPGQVFQGVAADAIRRQLVLQLRDPAPLSGLGLPLFVSEPVALNDAYQPSNLEVEVQTAAPLAPHGTLRGLTIAVDWHRLPVQQFFVNVDALTEAPLRALFAPQYELGVERKGSHQASATFTGHGKCTAFDLTVLLSTGNEPVRLDLLAYRYAHADPEQQEDGKVLALLSADVEQPATAISPRDIAVVVDRSGSMKGAKIDQARKAVGTVLGGLRAEDRFVLVGFSGDVSSFASQAVAASATAVTAAQKFASELEAAGGTNIHDALAEAFSALPEAVGRPRYLLLLTDGRATTGVSNTNAILDMARTANEEIGARIFTFGIGHDVNTVLLDQLAKQSGGAPIYIAPGASVDASVQAFFAQISDPVLTAPRLVADGFALSDLQPTAMGDIFAGQTRVLVGRYAKPGVAKVSLQGYSQAKEMAFNFQVALPAHAVSTGYVPRIWATRRVGAILHKIKLGDPSPMLVESAMSLARRYGIVTEFTYFAKNEAGDAELRYSKVPVAQTGSVAVGTSSSLDGYQRGASAATAADQLARYGWDRVLTPMQAWFTDSTIGEQSTWVDIHFGSDAYFSLATAEAKLGIGTFLSVADQVRFEFFGRNFRITDAVAAYPSPPDEATTVPAPAPNGGAGQTSATWLGDQVGAGAITEKVDKGTPLVSVGDTGAAAGCSAGREGAAPDGSWLLLLALAGWGLTRRRRLA